MENNFTIEKAKFIENYNLARPIIRFWQQVEPMLKRCIKERERRI